MATTPVSFISGIISQISVGKQLDVLHFSIIDLLDLTKDGGIDAILEEPRKTTAQKTAFIKKIVESVESPELHDALESELAAGNLDFFSGKYLRDLLMQLQREAEKIISVKLTVAIDFKKADLAQMNALLTEKLGRRVAIDLSVDKGLIAGCILQYGSYISDYSVKTRLEQFRLTWKAAVIEKA